MLIRAALSRLHHRRRRHPFLRLIPQIFRPPWPLLQHPMTRPFSHSPKSQWDRRPWCGERAFLAQVLKRCDDFSPNNPFLSIAGKSQLRECVDILLSFGLPHESIVSSLSSSPSLLESGFLRKWKLGFSRLRFCNCSPMLALRVLNHSCKFGVQPDGLARCLEEFKELGIENETFVKILEDLPGVPLTTLGVVSRIQFLKSYSFQNHEIDQICSSFPGFLVFSIESRLKPLFLEFGDLGFCKEELRRRAIVNPRLLLGMEVGELSRYMDLLRALRCRLPIKERITRNGLLHASLEVKLRVDCLIKHGLIRREAFKVVWVEPRTILYKLEDMEQKIKFLSHTMGFCIEWLVEVPEYLGVNFENQIVPRYQVIEWLKSNGALGVGVDLRQLIKSSRKKFYNMFVKPYPECEKIFGGALRSKEETKTRHHHPSGLWKLFKPSNQPSEEEMENIKLFMSL